MPLIRQTFAKQTNVGLYTSLYEGLKVLKESTYKVLSDRTGFSLRVSVGPGASAGVLALCKEPSIQRETFVENMGVILYPVIFLAPKVVSSRVMIYLEVVLPDKNVS